MSSRMSPSPSRPLFFSLPGNEAITESLSSLVGGEIGRIETRQFPDGESYVRITTDPSDRSVILVCTLDHPDAKFLQLTFAAASLRDLKAKRVGLVAPYLAYMRQDKQFLPGEAVSSIFFARLLSSSVDWLVTVDPHLHRHKDLDRIFTIKTHVVHAAPLLAQWIKSNIQKPLLIGPDEESEQWVSAVAAMANAPYRVLKKERRGDREVEVAVPDLHHFASHVPVLIDDIVSSGRTMLVASRHLSEQGLPAAVCLAVHALFSAETYSELRARTSVVATTNSIPHVSNVVDVAELVSHSLQDFL